MSPLLWSSEVEFERELHHARITGRSDGAKSCAAVNSIRSPERRRVREVEDFCAEVETESLRNHCSFNQRESRRSS